MKTEQPLEQAVKLLETPEPFRAWLAERPNAVVGHTSECHSCPIAMFLNHHGLDLRVEQTVLTTVPRGDMMSSLPEWARSFIRRLDFHPAYEGTQCLVPGEVALLRLAEALAGCDGNVMRYQTPEGIRTLCAQHAEEEGVPFLFVLESSPPNEACELRQEGDES